jgi:hypothetical protein
VADPIETLMAALSRLDDDGNRVFPVEDLRHAIPLIVLLSGLDLSKVSEGVLELMVETSLAAGLDPEADPPPTAEETIEAFEAYFHDRPVSPAILDEIRKAFESLPGAPSKAAQALLGTERTTGVLGGGARPEGTIPGALGRLQTMAPRGKK